MVSIRVYDRLNKKVLREISVDAAEILVKSLKKFSLFFGEKMEGKEVQVTGYDLLEDSLGIQGSLYVDDGQNSFDLDFRLKAKNCLLRRSEVDFELDYEKRYHFKGSEESRIERIASISKNFMVKGIDPKSRFLRISGSKDSSEGQRRSLEGSEDIEIDKNQPLLARLTKIQEFEILPKNEFLPQFQQYLYLRDLRYLYLVNLGTKMIKFRLRYKSFDFRVQLENRVKMSLGMLAKFNPALKVIEFFKLTKNGVLDVGDFLVKSRKLKQVKMAKSGENELTVITLVRIDAEDAQKNNSRENFLKIMIFYLDAKTLQKTSSYLIEDLSDASINLEMALSKFNFNKFTQNWSLKSNWPYKKKMTLTEAGRGSEGQWVVQDFTKIKELNLLKFLVIVVSYSYHQGILYMSTRTRSEELEGMINLRLIAFDTQKSPEKPKNHKIKKKEGGALTWNSRVVGEYELTKSTNYNIVEASDKVQVAIFETDSVNEPSRLLIANQQLEVQRKIYLLNASENVGLGFKLNLEDFDNSRFLVILTKKTNKKVCFSSFNFLVDKEKNSKFFVFMKKSEEEGRRKSEGLGVGVESLGRGDEEGVDRGQNGRDEDNGGSGEGASTDGQATLGGGLEEDAGEVGEVGLVPNMGKLSFWDQNFVIFDEDVYFVD